MDKSLGTNLRIFHSLKIYHNDIYELQKRIKTVDVTVEKLRRPNDQG